MPATQYLLTAVEWRTPYFTLGGEVDNAGAGHDMVVDDIQYPLLISTDDAILKIEVIVIALQFDDGFLTLLAHHLSHGPYR